MYALIRGIPYTPANFGMSPRHAGVLLDSIMKETMHDVLRENLSFFWKSNFSEKEIFVACGCFLCYNTYSRQNNTKQEIACNRNS